MARKIRAKTDNSGWVDPTKKKRKKRKPMTEKQRQAAAERLEKAREVRAAKNPDYGKSGLHESIRDLLDDHPISPKKVKKWVKTQKELASMERKNEKGGIKGATDRKLSHEAYVRNMQRYLRDGDWVDYFYGEHQEYIIRSRCVSLAYDKDGNPKRNVGTYYPDILCVYTKEMFKLDRGVVNEERPKRKIKRRKRNKRTVESKGKKRNSSS